MLTLKLTPLSLDQYAAVALTDMLISWPDMLVRVGFDPTLALEIGVLHAAQWVAVIAGTEAGTFNPKDIH